MLVLFLEINYLITKLKIKHHLHFFPILLINIPPHRLTEGLNLNVPLNFPSPHATEQTNPSEASIENASS
jgi:hypothetical protein